MVTIKNQEVTQPTMDESVEQIRAQLEQEKRRVCAEIDDYPHPIPACDAQFNYLLEERARIFQELSRLDARLKKNQV
jgi:hypothetical protein